MTSASRTSVRAGGSPAGADRASWRRLFAAPVVTALALAGLAGCATADQPAAAPSATTSSAAPESAAPAAPESAAPAAPEPATAAPDAPEPAAAPLAASIPALVEIDALGVSQEVIGLGLAPDGTMEVPRGAEPVGWYDRGPTPGEPGPSVLAGHLTWNGTDGVFRHLAELAAGDEVRVTRADGTVATFAVTRVEQYAKDAFPTARVYANTAGPELRLITCAGDLDAGSGDYSDNVVAYAELVG